MQQLDFADVDDDGRLVVVADDGTRYAVPVDDRLRAALRPRRITTTTDGQGPSASAKEVQAMIRAGQTAEEVAAVTGWEADRVRRFESPVLAERQHVVGLARAAHVRAQGRTDGTHTLERRVLERLGSRGVPSDSISWDAARSESHGPWTVLVIFSAGGRERRAAWHYGVQDRSVEALDDEARWLSEDEQALPGGLAGHPLLGSSHSEDETADLMATMRERRQARGRRTRRTESRPTTEGRTGDGVGHADEVLPLENLPEPTDRGGEGGTHDDGSLPPAAHPRGSAPESPSPVHPPEHDGPEGDVDGAGADVQADADVEAESTEHRPKPARGRSQREARARRERRRLRMPKLPPAVGEPVPQDGDASAEEVAFARTHDPQEVSFDEFFGPEDDPLSDADPGQDEPVEDEEQIASVDAGEAHADAGVDGADTDPADTDEAEAGTHDGTEADDGADVTDEADDAPAAEEVDPHVTDEHPDDEPTDVPADGKDDSPAAQDDAADQGKGTQEPEPSRRRGRTSVPSWDDVMFGGSDRRRR